MNSSRLIEDTRNLHSLDLDYKREDNRLSHLNLNYIGSGYFLYSKDILPITGCVDFDSLFYYTYICYPYFSDIKDMYISKTPLDQSIRLGRWIPEFAIKGCFNETKEFLEKNYYKICYIGILISINRLLAFQLKYGIQFTSEIFTLLKLVDTICLTENSLTEMEVINIENIVNNIIKEYG